MFDEMPVWVMFTLLVEMKLVCYLSSGQRITDCVCSALLKIDKRVMQNGRKIRIYGGELGKKLGFLEINWEIWISHVGESHANSITNL